MATFKKGDRVKLISGDGMAAPAGALATVTADHSDGRYLHVKWDPHGGDIQQGDGGYYPKQFQLVRRPKHDLPTTLLVHREKDGKTSYLIAEEDITAVDHDVVIGVYTLTSVGKVERSSRFVSEAP
jgi:hypothetical protein